MKTILLPTDFSPIAENAARYGLYLAQWLNADLHLVNVAKAPMETHIGVNLVWPPVETETVLNDSLHHLALLAKRLSLQQSEITNQVKLRQPHISYSCELGELVEIIDHATANHEISMVVTGVHDAGGFIRAVSGSNSHDMIEHSRLPLILIPEGTNFKPIKTIAFATDLSENDINVVCSLASMARVFNAEILLIHICEANDHHKVADFLSAVTNQANYPNIYYRGLVADDIDSGLKWVLEHRQVEMLAMVHHRHNLIARLLNQSHTQHMANHLDLPLMVFPAGCKAVVL